MCHASDKRLNQVRQLTNYLDKSIVPAIGAKPVRDVTTEDVRAIIRRKKDERFDAAAGEIRGVLKRLFDYAPTAGLDIIDPADADADADADGDPAVNLNATRSTCARVVGQTELFRINDDANEDMGCERRDRVKA